MTVKTVSTVQAILAKHPTEQMKTWLKFLIFTVISGTGLLMSFGILWVGVRFFGLAPFVANAMGDTVAVSFVFIVSSRKAFYHDNKYMALRFVVWLLYNALMIAAISYGVEAGAHVQALRSIPLIPPHVCAKALIAPVSLYINFLFASLIIEKIRI